MPDLKFNTGLVTYDINGKAQLTFNPTDSAFVERLHSTFEALAEKDEAYKAEIAAVGEDKKIFEIARRRDAEMRALLDETLGSPVCDALFGAMNVYAMADGLPAWCNLMFTIMDEIDASMTREQKAMSPRMAKYAAKYRKGKA